MQILKRPAQGPAVELLQLALLRAAYYSGALDGNFGAVTENALQRFQRAQGLLTDGIAGEKTWQALSPWLYGYRRLRLQSGDTLWKLSQRYNTSLAAVETANPGLDPFHLRPGAFVNIPLSFPLVPENVTCSFSLLSYCIQGLLVRYPFLKTETIGNSVMGKPLYALGFGAGPYQVLYNGAHHGNEWITSSLLLLFLERLCIAYTTGGSIGGVQAQALYSGSSIWTVPMVNPDGVDLACGMLNSGPFYQQALSFSKSAASVAFPAGWKANINGVDLNLQYPAGWENAKKIKFSQGYTAPGPRDYVGEAPLSQPESRAMADFTQRLDPALTLSYHSQGQVIYWKYLDIEPPGARALAIQFSILSGYTAEDTPYASGFAGYKDWFIQDYNRPGFTIEVGLGENPLPITQLPEIYRANAGILAQAAEART